MGNFLSMKKKETIISLYKELGWNISRIHRETKHSRATVRKYVNLDESKMTTPTTGESVEKPSNQRSKCEPYRQIIMEKLKAGQHGMSIHYDLDDLGFKGSYESVKRFISRMKTESPHVVGRVITNPGEEAQVDFGKGGLTRHPKSGQWRRPNLFVMTLSHSGKHYAETVWRQNQQTWVECHRRAFEHFGGVPKIVRIDNLKAGVIKAEWFDPILNKLYESLSRHYGFEIIPCRVSTPEEKGKVENGVNYVQGMVAGRRFDSIDIQNEFLMNWEERKSRFRIHGRTKKQVQTFFETTELPALTPLPEEPFEMFQIGYYRVGRDGFVEVQRAYYSVPSCLGRRLEVRWSNKIIRIYDPSGRLLVSHLRKSPGTVTSRPGDLPSSKSFERASYERYLLEEAGKLGNDALEWSRAVLKQRGTIGMRVIRGMIYLGNKYGSHRIGTACQEALATGRFRYHVLKELCERASQQLLPIFDNENDVIRPLTEYSQAAEESF